MTGMRTKPYLLKAGFHQIRRKHVPGIKIKQRPVYKEITQYLI